MVPPDVPVVLLAVLVICKSALATTINPALTVAVFVPTDVVREPAGMVLVMLPDTELVTTTETEQLAPGGIKVPAAKVKVPKPGFELAPPPIQLVCATELVELTNPVG